MAPDIASSCYFGGDALNCLLSQLVAATGGNAMFGLMAGALIFMVFYIASEGDMATPTVALILTGTVFVAMVPDNYGEIGAAIVMLGLAAAIWQVLKQYVLSGAAQ
jgi:hypothetical protein